MRGLQRHSPPTLWLLMLRTYILYRDLLAIVFRVNRNNIIFTGSCKVTNVIDASKEPESFVYESRPPRPDVSPQYFLGPSTVIVEMSTLAMDVCQS